MKDFNLLDLDYREEAAKLPKLPYSIIDLHSHIHGKAASAIYAEVATLFGVSKVFSMTPLEELDDVRASLGDRLELITFPKFRGDNPEFDHGEGYCERIREYDREGAKIAKFWAAPRGKDFAEEYGIPGYLDLDTPHRRKAMEIACELGMTIMVHVADPDTWFQAKYSDSSRYGTKEAQYEPLRRLIEEYPTKWIAAHMGGFSEDLHFLSDLLRDHPTLHLDSSAAKWIIREISKHPREEVLSFFKEFHGRIFFGSDIVTSDDHLAAQAGDSFKGNQATNADEAFQLYASRYWALRHLWETDIQTKSPIADPDLHLVEPDKFSESDSPELRGKSLPKDILKTFYSEAYSIL